MTSLALLAESQWFLVVLALWSLPWKGFALWKAARRHHTVWFVALLVLNTVGILPILYIFFFSKKRLTRSKQEFSS